MSLKFEGIIKNFREALNANDSKTKPYDTTAEVKRVEGDTVWVEIPGGYYETPVKRTIDASEGDAVRVRVSGNRAYLIGNETSPPTDDSKANEALHVIKVVQKDVAVIDHLVAENANITKAQIQELYADTAVLQNVAIGKGSADEFSVVRLEFDEGIAGKLSADEIYAVNGVFDAVMTERVDASNVDAKVVEFETALGGVLSADKINAIMGDFRSALIGYLEVQRLNSNYAHIQNGVIDNAKIAYADVNDLDTHYAHITNGIIDNAEISYADVTELSTNYARIGLENVTNSWIQNGVIRDAAIGDAQIGDVSANKLTAGTINAALIRVINLEAKNLKIETADGYVYVGERRIPTKEFLDSVVDELQDEIDGAIETFTGSTVPSLYNTPAQDWTTDDERDKHVGDIYYVVNENISENGYCYRFMRTGEDRLVIKTTDGSIVKTPDNKILHENYVGHFEWVLIKDSDVTAALQRLIAVEGDVSGLKTFETTTTAWITDTDEELASVKSRTTSLETNMGNKVDVTVFNTLSQTVDTNTANITALNQTVAAKADGSTVTALSNRVNTISQTVDTNTASISALNTEIETKADSSTVSSLSSQVNTISQTVDTNTANIASLSETVETKADGSTVSNLSNQVNTISQTVDSNSAAILSLSEEVDTKADSSTVSTLSSTVNTISQTVDANSSSITALNQTVATKADSSTVSALSTTVNTISQSVDGNSSNLSNLTTLLGTNADGTTKANDIVHKQSALEQDLNGFKTTVSSTYQTIDAMSGYSTTEEMNSAISQSASGISQTVSELYQTKAAMSSYSTTTQMNSAIDSSEQAANTYADGVADAAEQNAKDDTDRKLINYYNRTEIDQTATAITQSIEDAVTARKTIIRAFNGGTITAYVGNSTGVYTNAEGSVDIVQLSWSGDEPTITGYLASFGESINFSSDVPQYIGSEDAYIVFNPSNNSITIGGSNVNFGNSTLSDILSAMDKANRQATLTISTDYSFDSTVTLTAHMYNGKDDLLLLRPASSIAWYARSEDPTEPVKFLGTGRSCTYNRNEAGFGTSVVCRVYEDEDVAIKTPNGMLVKTPDGKVMRGRIA